MTAWVAVATGGALGSLARHGVNMLATRWLGRPSPYATLTVNILGCASIGILAGLLASGRITMSPAARMFVFVGLLGGFTTFSSFGLDTFTLALEGRRTAAIWNVVAQVLAGGAAVALGYALASKP